MKKMVMTLFACSVLTVILSQTTVNAQETTAATKEKQQEYSPYLEQDFPQQVYFGDAHLHTSYSTDAGMLGNRLGPDEAYRFARGEEVVSSTGTRARLSRPLDWLVVADHAENLGLAPMIAEDNAELLKTEFGKKVYALVKAGDPWKAYAAWGAEVSVNNDPLAGQTELLRSMWERITSAAERNNAPGKFTALIGYEWTSSPAGNNLHRNIIFRDDKTLADKILPFSSFDSQDPEKLWEWMAAYEKNTGGRMLAIPHNGNLSNGLMFDNVTYTDKKAYDKDYAERRQRWEPLYEVTQIKGDGEANPSLSPNDEFADFETWDRGSFGPEAKTPDMLPREYAREALKRGLAFEEQLGANPFKFGMIGSTDSHTSLATAQEDNFFGKVAVVEPGRQPARFDMKITGYLGGPVVKAWETGASGLAAVWAKENTREALFDAMARKEVYATTGKRMILRVFAGYDFAKDDLYREDFARNGYSMGVPMGGDLSNAPQGKAPVLLVSALRDAMGANLDRIQIVKGWLDSDGKTQERIYDVAVSDGRKIGADGRCTTPVGNTVDVEKASYKNSIGAPQLLGYWQDPQFDPAQRAFYYARVLEIPTPRWTTHDAKICNIEPPKDAPASIQDRAYSSPIWYTP